MSSYDAATTVAPKPGTARRSGTLTIAAATGGVGALGGIIWAIMLLSQGKDLIKPAVQDFAQQTVGDVMSSGLIGIDDLVDTAYQSFSARADIWLVLGVLSLAAAGLVFAARNWARIVLAVLGLASIGLAVRDLTDIAPGVLKALDAVVVIGMVAAVVCQWLPGSNRAVRARKAAR